MVATGYTNETMPAVALRPKGHEPITTSVSAQLRWYGGRRGGRVQLEAAEIADIYKEASRKAPMRQRKGRLSMVRLRSMSCTSSLRISLSYRTRSSQQAH